MNIQLKAVVICGGPRCTSTAEVLIDFDDFVLDLNSRSVSLKTLDPGRLPTHWDDAGYGLRCPMCYLRNV